jgi:hypothetical protein
MKAYDYEAVTYDADVYCVGCLPDDVSVDDEEVGPIFADSEWDHYPVCAHCGTVHDYVSLTTYGRDQLRRDARSEPFTRAYIECALWSSTDNSRDDGGDPLDQNYGPDDIADDTLDEMIDDCRQFQADNTADIGDEHARAGHDFWLTRNGHGAGFWDRPEVYGQAQADRLSEACDPWGSYDLYIGDDGQIYGS